MSPLRTRTMISIGAVTLAVFVVLLVVVLIGAAIAKSRSTEAGIPISTEKAVVKTITQLVTATGKVLKRELR